MNTQGINIAHTYAATEKVTATVRMNWFEKQAAIFEKGRFGLMALFITLESCVGSVAAMYLLENDASIWMLITCAVVTMGANALLIAQASAKTCVAAIYANILINTALILLNV